MLYAALVIAPFGLFLREMHTLRVMNSNPFFNISDIDDNYTTVATPVVSVHALGRIAAVLCEPATLHLRLAAIFEATSATALRNACGRWPDLHFAGRSDGVHLAGLPSEAGVALGILPDREVAGMAFFSHEHNIEPTVSEP